MVVRNVANVIARVRFSHTARRINLMVKSFASTELLRVRFSHAPPRVISIKVMHQSLKLGKKDRYFHDLPPITRKDQCGISNNRRL